MIKNIFSKKNMLQAAKYALAITAGYKFGGFMQKRSTSTTTTATTTPVTQVAEAVATPVTPTHRFPRQSTPPPAFEAKAFEAKKAFNE